MSNDKAKKQTKESALPITQKDKEGAPEGDSIAVKIYSPFKVYLDEPARSISAENDTGPFDILPQHHNFMTLLNACELVVNTVRGSEERIEITRGVMHVKQDRVIVFLDV